MNFGIFLPNLLNTTKSRGAFIKFYFGKLYLYIFYLSSSISVWIRLSGSIRQITQTIPYRNTYCKTKSLSSLRVEVIIYKIISNSGGSRISRRGRKLPRRLRFENFVCRNERIWTLGGACAGHAPSRSANVKADFISDVRLPFLIFF